MTGQQAVHRLTTVLVSMAMLALTLPQTATAAETVASSSADTSTSASPTPSRSSNSALDSSKLPQDQPKPQNTAKKPEYSSHSTDSVGTNAKQGDSTSASAQGSTASGTTADTSAKQNNSAPATAPDANAQQDSATAPANAQGTNTGATAPNSANPSVSSCQTAAGDQSWGETDPLIWNIHTDGSDCVLELKSGTVPDYRTSDGNYAKVPWDNGSKNSWTRRDDISKVKVTGPVKALSVHGLFAGLSNMITADVGNLDLTNLVDGNIGDLFAFDSSLASITGLEQWNTSKATSLKGIFNGDTSLTVLDLSSWNMTQVTDFSCMFGGLGKTLTRIGLGSKQSLPAEAFRQHYDNNGNAVDDDSWKDTTWKLNSETATTIEPYNNGLHNDNDDISEFVESSNFSSQDNIKTEDRHNVVNRQISPRYYEWYTFYPNIPGQGGLITKMLDGNNCLSFPTPDWSSPGDWSRPGYQPLGWSQNPNATSPSFRLGFSSCSWGSWQGGHNFYVVWGRLPTTLSTPTATGLTSPDALGMVTLNGTLNSGDTIFPLEANDKVATWHMPTADPRSTAEGVGVESTSESLNPTGHTWNAKFNVADLAADDKIGSGVSPPFRLRLQTVNHGNGSFVFTQAFKTDFVAPAIDQSTLKFDFSARTVTGSVWSSGNAETQSNRIKESGDTVTITWPAGSTPTTQTTTTGPGGTFSVSIPSGVAYGGTAQITVKDAPAADAVTLTGRGTPNESAAVPLELTIPVVSSLPLTGGFQLEHYRTQTILATLCALAAFATRLTRRSHLA
ncbi:BspA family leucine-rich repeat surface protein [Bifidobacterium sp. ESL0745]|uniref:BspA family leucine-rich repeat surface protein n=1 Tax=Bifidobacterium sp. ESL0745 TaxID=2983226 RepID=UPI0023F7528F|nr:BspA family leucine-rich repeat surface protein [Bifidobacterium sp. ESL0745]MDF7666097.1 BspA family leucine-rich repeat surface protein [Bifidobacterium sp. ESL0745]